MNPEEWEKDSTTIRPGESTPLCDCVASSGEQPSSLCFSSLSSGDVGAYTCVQPIGFGSTARCTVRVALAGEKFMLVHLVCVCVCVCVEGKVWCVCVCV